MLIKKFKWPDASSLSKEAFKVLKLLKKAGFEAFITGGAVRAALLKKPITEIDIATSAKPVEVEKLFKRTLSIGREYGTVTVIRLRGSKLFQYEVTSFRQEFSYKDRRRPSAVKFISQAELDARRRDFTINGLLYDIGQEQVIDYIGGLSDLKRKVVRCIGSPNEKFQQDALRLIRAIRFAASFGFKIEPKTKRAIKKYSNLIKNVSAERIKFELDKLMLSKKLSTGIKLLFETGLWSIIFPGIKPEKYFITQVKKMGDRHPLVMRYALLFQDKDKAQIKKITKKLRFSREEIEAVMQTYELSQSVYGFKQLPVHQVRKMALQRYFLSALELFRIIAKDSQSSRENYRLGLKVGKEVEVNKVFKKKLISGVEVMKILSIKEGRLVGKLLSLIEDEKLKGVLKTKKEAMEYIKINREKFKRLK